MDLSNSNRQTTSRLSCLLGARCNRHSALTVVTIAFVGEPSPNGQTLPVVNRMRRITRLGPSVGPIVSVLRRVTALPVMSLATVVLGMREAVGSNLSASDSSRFDVAKTQPMLQKGNVSYGRMVRNCSEKTSRYS